MSFNKKIEGGLNVGDNPVRYIDPDGMTAGDFLDRNGKNIGSDGKQDGILYVLNTDETSFPTGEGQSPMPGAGSTLSNKDAAKMVASGNIDYNEFTEIPGSENTRQGMMNEVNKDAKDNSTEHGGVVTTDGTIIPTTPVGSKNMDYNTALDPSQQEALDNTLKKDGNIVFHGHSSKQQDNDYYTFDQGQRVVKTEPNNVQVQSPSNTDKVNIQGPVKQGIEFGMGISKKTGGTIGGGGQRVYIFDGRGVRATLPLNKFAKQ